MSSLHALNILTRCSGGVVEDEAVAQRWGRVSHQARLQFQGYDRGPVTFADTTVGSTQHFEGAAQAMIFSCASVVALLIEYSVDKKLLVVSVGYLLEGLLKVLF
jgi:hypothetical protein